LLIAYEGGVLWLGGPNPDSLRNGADAWVRWGLARYGFGQLWAAPLLVVTVFLARSLANWSGRPRQLVRTLFGMAVESAAFAVAHHVGPYGEWPIDPVVFAFRAVAGLYFTALYVGRGFGVAVGAHAGYDVLVGVTV